MTKIIKKKYWIERECRCCNWKVHLLYSLDDKEIRIIGEREIKNLCGVCFLNTLEKEGIKIK